MASAVIGALRVNLGIDSAQFIEGLKSAQGALRNAGKQMQSVGRSMSTYVTAPLTGFGAYTLKVAGDFEKAMNQVSAVSGATGDEFVRLRDLAKELGATTQFSSSEAADAMGFLAMAGMEVNDILGAMPDTLKLAAAAQLDMASSADIVTNILAGYNKGVDELGHATDVLVKSFTSANTDLRGLAEAMKYAGPVASAAGVQFEEAAAALAMMGNAGIQGSMAGTSLRGAISRILAPTKSMRSAMDEAGLAFTDASGKLLPLADIIEQLEPHAEDAGLFMELFGQRAGPAMAALVTQGSDAVRELTGELENSAGTASEIAAVQMEGFNGAMRELTSAFEGLQLAIADSGLIEWATQAVQAVTRWVQSMSQSNPEILKWGVIVGGLAAAVGPVVLVLGTLAAGIAAVGIPVAATIAGVVAFGAALVAFGPQILAFLSGAWASFEAAWDGIVTKVHTVKDAIVQFAADLLTSFADIPAQMMEIGGQIIEGLWQGLQAKWESVKARVSGIGSGIANSFRSVLGIHSPSRVMHDIGLDIMQGLQNGLEEGGKPIAGQLQTAADGIASTFDGIGSSIAEAIKGTKSWRDVALDAISSIARYMLSTMNFGGGGLGGLFKGLFGGLLGFSRGGTIMPGGSGGIDSQLVVFRKSPNERVDITKPGQTIGRGEGYSPVYNIDARGADAAAVGRIEMGLRQRDREFGSKVDTRNDTRQFRRTRA